MASVHTRGVAKYRIYFNRHGAEPLMWCVSPEDGSWEIAVRDVEIHDVDVKTVYKPKPTADEDDGKPSAWIEASGSLDVRPGGIARICGE